MNVTVTAADTQPSTTRTALYSRRPTIAVTGLKPGSSYHFTAELTDPYGNRSVLREVVSAAPGSGQ